MKLSDFNIKIGDPAWWGKTRLPEEGVDMNVLSLLGSPHKNGSTSKILDWIDEALLESGHTVSRIQISNGYKGCLACYKCQEDSDHASCVVDNDIYNEMIKADAIIFASPAMLGGISSQLKGVIDRSYCIISGYMSEDWKTLIEGKNLGLVISGAGPIEGNMDEMPICFGKYTRWTKTNHVGNLMVGGCMPETEMKPEVKDQAKSFAEKMVS